MAKVYICQISLFLVIDIFCLLIRMWQISCLLQVQMILLPEWFVVLMAFILMIFHIKLQANC